MGRMLKGAAALLILGAALWVGEPRPAAAQMSDIDRRLNVAVLGFSFDPQAAEAVLKAGADINHRNDANDNDTLLIDAIRGFKEPAVVKWLLEHGADPAAANAQGRTALDYARQYNIGGTAQGRAILAMLGGPTAQARPVPAPAAAPARTATAARPAAPPAAPPPAVGAPAAAAGLGGAPQPGVYECINQQAMATPLAFGIIDGSSYMASNGRRGRYSYDAASATLTLDPDGEPARYRRISATTFRLVRPDGGLGGFTCPLNRAKNPQRPPW